MPQSTECCINEMYMQEKMLAAHADSECVLDGICYAIFLQTPYRAGIFGGLASRTTFAILCLEQYKMLILNVII